MAKSNLPSQMPLVPGRECGGCNVCCIFPEINDVELSKRAGDVCPNCTVGVGCKIYESRPKSCREYYCGWRSFPELGENWRPDRSGVFIMHQVANIPERFAIRHGLVLHVIGPWRTVLQPRFVRYVAKIIAKGIPTFLSIPGPTDHLPRGYLLNDTLGTAVKAKDHEAIRRDLLEALQRIKKDQRFVREILHLASAPP